MRTAWRRPSFLFSLFFDFPVCKTHCGRGAPPAGRTPAAVRFAHKNRKEEKKKRRADAEAT
jgi:hypothetical protein